MTEYLAALTELEEVLNRVDGDAIDRACGLIAKAKKIVLYGCGREGLQMQGFAMRLYHLGLDATMVGDMSTPPLGEGDLFVASAGPGELSTVTALMTVARRDGADVLFLTATPNSDASRLAEHVLLIPAQTMASDRNAAERSLLPMGSIYEGALFLVFETMILRLRDQLGATPEEMRARHTNME